MARKLIHTRTIVVEAYDEGDGTVTLEGRLEDRQPEASGYFANRLRGNDPRPRGVIHGMSAELRVDRETATIVKAGGDFPHTPMQGCEAVMGWLSRLDGVRIAHGYTTKARELLGGPRGCSHMNALLQAMASTNNVASTYFRSPDRAVNLRQVKKLLEAGTSKMTDTCHMWRQGGPIETQLRKELERAEAEGLL